MIWYERLCTPDARRYGERLRIDRPLDTLTTVGVGGAGAGGGDWYWMRDERVMPDTIQTTTKPPYAVPLMSEIAALPWNGLNVVSTFAGAGGSSTGYRMAGYRVLWVNEFIEAARDTYRANAREGTIVDGRDVRHVKGSEILEACALGVGELDVLDGSPPCSSFSMAGKRSEHWGQSKKYSDTEQRTDDLFFEYARLLGELRPKVFVAENVSGLVKGVAKGYFLEILTALQGSGYRVSARLLDAQWLGVPQQRQRLIFVGVRDDLDVEPAHPEPLPYRYSIRDALPWLTRVKGGTKQPFAAKGEQMSLDTPSRTIIRGSTLFDVEGPAIDDYAIAKEWEKLGDRKHTARYLNLRRDLPTSPVGTITAIGGSSPGTASVTHPTEKRKFSIVELKRLCSFPDDYVLTGTYAQQWERLGRAVPPVMMSHIAATIRDRIFGRSTHGLR